MICTNCQTPIRWPVTTTDRYSGDQTTIGQCHNCGRKMCEMASSEAAACRAAGDVSDHGGIAILPPGYHYGPLPTSDAPTGDVRLPNHAPLVLSDASDTVYVGGNYPASPKPIGKVAAVHPDGMVDVAVESLSGMHGACAWYRYRASGNMAVGDYVCVLDAETVAAMPRIESAPIDRVLYTNQDDPSQNGVYERAKQDCTKWCDRSRCPPSPAQVEQPERCGTCSCYELDGAQCPSGSEHFGRKLTQWADGARCGASPNLPAEPLETDEELRARVVAMYKDTHSNAHRVRGYALDHLCGVELDRYAGFWNMARGTK